MHNSLTIFLDSWGTSFHAFPTWIFSSLLSCEEYYTMVLIPAGARSIHVQEMEVSTSYLAVRSMKKKYYLTGDWTVDWPGKFHFGGTMFDYQRSFNKPESLYAAGPTNETLVFEVSRHCWVKSICANWHWQGLWQFCSGLFFLCLDMNRLDWKKMVGFLGEHGLSLLFCRDSVGN